MAWWEPLGMRTAPPVFMSMASHDWFKSRRKVSSITNPFTSHESVQQSKSRTTNLIRVGGEFQIGPEFPPLRIGRPRAQQLRGSRHRWLQERPGKFEVPRQNLAAGVKELLA